VEAILEGAARVLVEDGLEAATTNRIARVAGVSIGSLYQYFGSKESVVRAMLDRHLAQAEALRPPELAEGARGIPLPRRIRAAVDWFLAVHALDPPLHRVLSDAGARLLGSRTLRAFERSVERRIRRVLEGYRQEIAPRDLDRAAFTLARTLEALAHGAVDHHPDWLARPELAEEMAELLLGYLRAPASRS
jgi:AcrR family transcriptional regulator